MALKSKFMEERQGTRDTTASERLLMPPGYRFYPTEEELICFYLLNKLQHIREEEMERVIPVVHIYSTDPWLLPLSPGSEQWFFFCPRQERELHGGRPARITPSGYWKATGSPGLVYSSNNRVIGEKKTMAFYHGRAPTGSKTKWKMVEYKAFEEDATSNQPNVTAQLRNEFSICRIYVNSGCVRSFDRRPSGAQVTVQDAQASTSQAAAAATAGGSFDSSSSGDQDIDWNVIFEELSRE